MLSEEQVIEKLKKIKEDTIKANECGLSNNDFREEIEVYDTVLNLITKRQKENKKLKDKNQDLLRKLRNRVKEVRKLTKYSLYKKEFSRLNEIIKEKDKQIDLMAEKINEAYFEENDFYIWFEEIFGIIPKGDYKDKIKQYFEKLAKEKGE